MNNSSNSHHSKNRKPQNCNSNDGHGCLVDPGCGNGVLLAHVPTSGSVGSGSIHPSCLTLKFAQIPLSRPRLI